MHRIAPRKDEKLSLGCRQPPFAMPYSCRGSRGHVPPSLPLDLALQACMAVPFPHRRLLPAYPASQLKRLPKPSCARRHQGERRRDVVHSHKLHTLQRHTAVYLRPLVQLRISRGHSQHPADVADTTVRRFLAFRALLVPHKRELRLGTLFVRIHMLDQMEQHRDRITSADRVLASARARATISGS